MELRVTQPVLRDAIQGRRRNDATKRARRTETAVVSHDEQHIGRALGWRDGRRPPRFRLRGLLLDYPAEFRIGWGKLFAVDGGRRIGRTDCAGGLNLGLGRKRSRYDSADKDAAEAVFHCLHRRCGLITRDYSTHTERAI